MSTITRKSITDTIEGLEQLTNRGIQSVYIDMAIAGLCSLLASLEAEAVGWRYRFVHTPKSEEHGSPFTTDWVLAHSEDECNPSDCYERQPLFTAPPAPVSVPDENGLLPCPCCGGNAEFDYDDDNLNWISCNVCGISTDTAYHTDVDARDKLREVWNRRAAMLQGEPTDDERIMAIEGIHNCERCGDEGWIVGEMGITSCACGQAGTLINEGTIQAGNSPVITGAEQRIADAVELLQKAAPAMLADNSGPDGPLAGRLKSPVIPDGWKLVPIDPTKDMLRAGQSVVGFWLNTVHCYSKMLAAAPAAPQQEVNNG